MKLPPSFFKTETWHSFDIWEQAVLLFLIAHTRRGENECWPSQGYMTRNLSIGRSKLLESLKNLEVSGVLLRIAPKYRGCKETTHYRIVLPRSTIQSKE